MIKERKDKMAPIIVRARARARADSGSVVALTTSLLLHLLDPECQLLSLQHQVFKVKDGTLNPTTPAGCA